MKRILTIGCLAISTVCFAQYGVVGISETSGDARYLQLTGGSLSGNITTTGYVEDKPCRAYAYLTESSNTTIVTENVWVPVDGIFSNVVSDGFGTTTVDGKPAIIYTNGYEGRFIVRLLGCMSSSPASATVGLTLKVSGNVQSMSGVPTHTFCKNAGESYVISNFGIPYITNGTTIQIMTTSDKTGDITFSQMKSKMERWR